MSATQYKLDNLIAVIDRNRLQISGGTEEVMHQDSCEERFAAFGWNVINIEDGNDMTQVCAALEQLPERDCEKRAKPTFIISNTVKGKGVSFMEGNHKWHAGGIGDEDLARALADVEKTRKV